MRTFVPDQRPLFTFVWCAGSSSLVDLTFGLWVRWKGEERERERGKGMGRMEADNVRRKIDAPGSG